MTSAQFLQFSQLIVRFVCWYIIGFSVGKEIRSRLQKITKNSIAIFFLSIILTLLIALSAS